MVHPTYGKIDAQDFESIQEEYVDLYWEMVDSTSLVQSLHTAKKDPNLQ